MKVISISANIRFEQLFKQSFDLLFDGLQRYAFSILKDNDLANDVVQSIFTKWWESKKELGDIQSVKAYLFTSIYRHSLNILRHEKVKITNQQGYGQQMAMSSNSLSDTYAFVELENEIQEAIQSLPPQCQLIFRKSRLEEKRYAEIAEEMNLSVKTVEAQIGKALKLMKEKLNDFYPLGNHRVKFKKT